MGYVQGLNAGIRFQFNQTQVGISADPGLLAHLNLNGRNGKFRYYILSTHLYQHIGGRTRYSRRKPWFVKLGFSYFKGWDNEKIRYEGLSDFVIGREINFSKRAGVSVATGLFCKFHEAYKALDPAYHEFTETSFGVPFEVNLFYRLGKTKH